LIIKIFCAARKVVYEERGINCGILVKGDVIYDD